MTPTISFSCLVGTLPRVRDGALRAVAVLLACMAALIGAVPAAAQEYDPPVATLVKNLDQPSGPDIRLVLSKNQDGLMQGFRTGPHQGGYELEGIWLYVRDTWESRYMTIDAGLYRDIRTRPRKVATLTRGQLNDYAHNEWKAAANTFLEPNTDYWFMLDCVIRLRQRQRGPVRYHLQRRRGWRRRTGMVHSTIGRCFGVPVRTGYYENDEALRIRVRGRPSPYRAYRTEIVSTPRDDGIYHYGEYIDVALTFNTAVYVPPGGSVIAIRVGDTADGSNYRAAEYHSGSQTNRLVYRYQVQLADTDADGISVDVGGPNSGFGGAVPTIVASFGLLPVIDYYPGLADDHHHRVDGSFHVHDVAITSSPAHEDGYRVGEDIDVTLTFTAEAYASGDSVVAIRVGDDGPGYRRAAYVSGSGTTRLTYRYQVQLTDYDADGISIPSSGFVRELPTTSPALGSIPVSRDYTGRDDAGHKVDGSFRVTGVAITSSPAHEDGYRVGEDIDVTMTFSTEAYTSGSVVAIRVGDTDDGSNYRPARYVAGSGTDRLVYRYRVQLTDFDADGISVDVGGPPSGFGERVPTTSPELGSVPVSRKYSGVPDDAGHKVDGSVTVAFGAPAFVVSEDGTTATVTVMLHDDPHREVIIPITATPGGGATPSDYSVSPTSLVFATGETRHSVTVTAVDDRDVDGGESVRLGFGTLPPGNTRRHPGFGLRGHRRQRWVRPDPEHQRRRRRQRSGQRRLHGVADGAQRPPDHGGLGHQRQRRGRGLRGGRHAHHPGRRDDRNGQRAGRRTAGRRTAGRRGCDRRSRSRLQLSR